MSVGVPAIGNFLTRLQLYKSTADFEKGQDMYLNYTAVSDEFLALREDVFFVLWLSLTMSGDRKSQASTPCCSARDKDSGE